MLPHPKKVVYKIREIFTLKSWCEEDIGNVYEMSNTVLGSTWAHSRCSINESDRYYLIFTRMSRFHL